MSTPISYKGDILIVDDQPANLKVLATMLTQRGYRVRPAINGSLALGAIEREQPGLILLDIVMPGMDGYEVCSILKQDPQKSAIPVIFMSALSDTKEKIKAFAAGAVDYITKPFQIEEVQARVETHLALRQAQRKLEESERRYRELIDHMSDGVAIYEAVDNGQNFVFSDINRAGLQIAQAHREEVVGTQLTQTFPGVEAVGLLTLMQEVWKSGEPGLLPTALYMDDRGEQWIESKVYKLPSGEVVLVYADVSDRQKAAADLAYESRVNAAMAGIARSLISSASLEEISHLVLAAAQDLTASQFGFVGYIDPETGYLVAPTMTREIWDMCQMADKDFVFKEFGGLWGWVLEHGEPILANQPLSDIRSVGTPAGHVPIERFLGAPAIIEGTLLGQVALANPPQDYTERDLDIAQRLAVLYALAVRRLQTEETLNRSYHQLETAHHELRNTQAQLVEQERLAAIGQLSTGLAHELNNTLSSVVLYTQMLMMSSRLPTSDRDKLNTILQQSQQAADLTQKLLDYSRKAMLHRHAMEFGAWLRSMEPMLAHWAGPNVQLHLDIAQVPMMIDGDQERLRQALSNLVTNARQAMESGPGRLEITLTPLSEMNSTPGIKTANPDEWICLLVRDTGQGIPADILPHIYNPFFTTRGPSTSGLGLSQVQGIVHQHGGQISVQSALGAGTTFWIYLPKLFAPEEQIEKGPA